MRLQTKILTATALIFLAHFLTVEYFNHRTAKDDVIRNVQEDARIVRGMLMSLRDVYQRQFLEHNVPITDKTLGFLPAHSISRISIRFREWLDTGLTFNNVSDSPWNPGNAADEIELKAIDYFRKNEGQTERLVPYLNEQREPYYHFSQPIWIKARCLKCHGPADTAPPSIQQRYVDVRPYELGELRGVMSIKLPASIIEQRVAEMTRQNIASHAIGFVGAFLVLSFLLRRTVLTPVERLDKTAQQLAAGDYQARAGFAGSDELAHVAQTFDEMAEQVHQREHTLTTQRAIFATLSESNKAIFLARSPQQLFEQVCDIVVRQGGLKVAWFGVVDEQGVHAVAAANNGAHPGNCGCRPPDCGEVPEPISRAIGEGQTLVFNALRGDTAARGWHAMAAKLELESAAVFPVLNKDDVSGTLTLFADAPGFFTSEVVVLLEELCRDIAAAVRNYALAEAHDAAHRQLQLSTAESERLNRQMTLLLESTGEGIYGVDTEGRCTFVNRAALTAFGFTRGELIGRNLHRLTHHTHSDGSPYDDGDCPVYNAFRTGNSCRVRNEVFFRKDGTSFPVEYSAYPMHEGDVVTGSVTVFRDVSESHKMAQEMKFLATHDSLTKLLNRYAFEQHLITALETSKTSPSTRFALCYMDLDQFKVVNDTFGHVAGDAMLQMIAHLLQQTVRQDDILARLGGDEFALLLDGCSLNQANRLGQKICDVISDFRFSWEDKQIATGISIGIVCIDHESESVARALSAADAACYMAKDLGRNRVYVQAGHDEELARRQGEMQWVAEIHSAIDERRLNLSYQPIVSIASEADKGEHFELLLRMRDRDGLNVPPGAFIPAAERYDLMPLLDRWVIRTAFEWFAAHADVTSRIDFFALNLSGQSLADDKLHEYIAGELDRTSLSPNKVCLEVTETAAVGRLDQAVSFINRLESRGLRFALDDFGTGMSSFAYLKTLPVDYLKIDGSFVKDIVSDPIDRAMVSSINQIGHLMGLETIAEYVENDEIMSVLRDLGVDYGQGFGIARPRPLADLLDQF